MKLWVDPDCGQRESVLASPVLFLLRSPAAARLRKQASLMRGASFCGENENGDDKADADNICSDGDAISCGSFGP